MKKFMLASLMVLLTCTITYSQNPYIHDGSIGNELNKRSPSKNTQVNQRKEEPYPNIEMMSWVGHRFIFLPTDKASQNSAYKSFKNSDDNQLDYSSYVGRIMKAVNIVTKLDENTYEEVVAMVEFELEKTKERVKGVPTYGSIDGIALVADIDNARSLWKGKTIWTKEEVSLSTYDKELDRVEGVDVKRFSSLKVIDVVAGWSVSGPVRLILKSSSGKTMYMDLIFSGTNSMGSNTFDTFFTMKDPRKNIKCSNKAWTAIQNERVFTGMTKEQARLSWGDPIEINKTITKSVVHEQWVYGDGSYLYFENGILTAIQN